MKRNLWKKIWLFCLCLACLSLVWCFHVPDEDWLLSDGEVKTWDVQKDEELEQALDTFMDWINLISSERNEIKNDEVNDWELEEDLNEIENENIDNESTVSDEEAVDEETPDDENQEIEDIVSEE